MPQMERTIYAALCGNLEQLRSVCTVWEDKLWAGAKCAVDVMVETEIRSQIIKNFAELPTEYWNSSTSLSKVGYWFDLLICSLDVVLPIFPSYYICHVIKKNLYR